MNRDNHSVYKYNPSYDTTTLSDDRGNPSYEIDIPSHESYETTQKYLVVLSDS